MLGNYMLEKLYRSTKQLAPKKTTLVREKRANSAK